MEEESESRRSGKLTAPSIEMEEIVAEGELELEVRAPEQAVVGRLTTYHILLRNSTQEAARRLKVVCRLPSGMRFPGWDADEFEVTTDWLEQGETKEWDLSLIADETGSKCCVFELRTAGFSAGDRPAVERSVCVEFSERQFSFDILGPGKRVENGRAEFILNVGNPSESARERVRVHVTFDRALKPHDVTERAVSSDENGIVWNLGTLEAGAKQQLQMEFNCLSPARRACVQVEITADGMEPEREEACLEITAQSGSIDLKLSDRIEPFHIGKRGVYDLKVKNIDLQPARNVAIEIKLPEELVVLSAKLKQGDADLEVQYSVRNDRLVFDPIDRLAADEEVEGVIEVEGVTSGNVELRASVTSSLNPIPVTTAESTIIDP